MKRLMMTALAIASLATLSAQQAEKTVTGVWNMAIQADHVIPIGMELKQDGKTVTGKILLPATGGGRAEIALSGEFAGGTLTVTGTNDTSGHASGKVDIVAKLLDDGTLEGTLTVPDHSVKWTAERLGR